MQTRQYKYISLLAMLNISISFIVPVLKAKFLMTPVGLITISSFMSPFWFLSLDIVSEVYGYRMGMKFFWSHLLCTIIIGIIFFILADCLLVNINSDYYRLFGSYLNMAWMECAAVIIAWSINARLLSYWRGLTKGKYFWLRSVGSSSIGESLFSIMLSPSWVLLGDVPTYAQAAHLTMFTCIIRIILTIIFAIPGIFIVAFLKRAESISAQVDQNIFPILDLKAVKN